MSGSPVRHMIRGERVFLRPAERTELPLMIEWFNDAETASFVTARAPLSMPLEEQWFDKMVADHGTSRWHFLICVIDSGQPIGTCSLFHINELVGSAGLGIVIGEKSLWGKGYGSDALNALVDFSFGELRLERLWLDVYTFNERAIRSYEKCGFKLEGTQRHAHFQNGRYQDLNLMSMLRDEWLALPRKKSWEYDQAAD